MLQGKKANFLILSLKGKWTSLKDVGVGTGTGTETETETRGLRMRMRSMKRASFWPRLTKMAGSGQDTIVILDSDSSQNECEA